MHYGMIRFHKSKGNELFILLFNLVFLLITEVLRSVWVKKTIENVICAALCDYCLYLKSYATSTREY